MLVHNSADAEDILQDTASIMWRKFDDFEPGTSFINWGKAIARYRIMKYRTKQKNSWLKFDNEIIDSLMPHSEPIFNVINDRAKALQNCISKLDGKDHKVIKMRYEQEATIRQVAKKMQRPVHGLYKTMARIHDSLHRCVQRTLTAWEVGL